MEHTNDKAEATGSIPTAPIPTTTAPASKPEVAQHKKEASGAAPKRQEKTMIAMIALAVLAVAGVGFGLYGMMSRGSKISDLEQKLGERDKTIAELGGVVEKPDDPVGESAEKPSDNVGSSTTQPLAKSLLISNPNQALNTGSEGAFVLSLSAASDSDFISLVLRKQVGGLTDFQKEHEAGSDPLPTEITGSINLGAGSGDVYGLGRSDIDRFKVANIDANRVVDILVSGFGQVVGDETAFFLMDDGTVEYMPMHKCAASREYKSYGKLPGVENAIKFMKAGLTYGPYGSGGSNALVQRADGKFYSLAEILREAGNY